MQLEESRIRIRVQAGVYSALVDSIAGDVPRIWRGADLRIDLAIFYLKALVDLENVTTLKLQMYDASRTGLPFLEKEVAAENITTALTLDQWKDGSGQHASVTATAAETNIVLNGIERSFWMVISGTTADDKKVTYGGGPIIFVEDGVDNGLPGPIVVTPASDSWRFLNGRWEMFFPDDESWRPMLPAMDNGQPTSYFGDPV